MEDVQSSAELRNVPLERVGVKNLSLPVMILERDGGFQHVTANATLAVEVAANIRGAHLSRFVETLTAWADQPISSEELRRLLELLRSRCESFSSEVSLSFKYFLPKAAPVSGIAGFLDYDCEFRGRLDDDGYDFTLGVTVPITTLCPCSRAISNAGAHNQRSEVRLYVRYGTEGFVWIEDLVSLVEAEGSSSVYPILKRPDEKFITEAAYANAKFVEDVARDVILTLQDVEAITWCAVECESHESIHNHNAFAAAERLFDREPVMIKESLELATGG